MENLESLQRLIVTMGVIVIVAIALVGATVTAVISEVLKTELLKLGVKVIVAIGDNYEQVSYDIAGMTGEMREFENNKLINLRTYISKESEITQRKQVELLDKIEEMDKLLQGDIEGLSKELATQIRREAWGTFNHYLLTERLHRLKEMESIRKGKLGK